MNRECAWTVGGKVRTWTFWLLAIAMASHCYVVQELLAAYAFFAIGFAVLVVAILSLYFLQKGWELAAVRIFDSERRIALGTRATILPVGQEGDRSKSAQDLKTENRNSKDWNGKGSQDWVDGEKCAGRI